MLISAWGMHNVDDLMYTISFLPPILVLLLTNMVLIWQIHDRQWIQPALDIVVAEKLRVAGEVDEFAVLLPMGKDDGYGSVV